MNNLDGKQKAIELFLLISSDCLEAIDRSRSQLIELRDQFKKSLELDSQDELLLHLVHSLDYILSPARSATIEL